MEDKYTHCPGCGRHCPADSLSCERGKRIMAALSAEDSGGFRKLYDSIDEAEQSESMDIREKHGCKNGMRGHCGHHEGNCAHRGGTEHEGMHCSHHEDPEHRGMRCSHHEDPEHRGMRCAHHEDPGHGAHRKGCPARKHRHPEPDENAPIEQKLLFKLHKCIHYLHSGAHGRAGQEKIISMLNEHGKMTQRELTELAGVRSASISEVLSKLERRGMIERTRNEEDRRNIDVHLTGSGKAVSDSHKPHMSDKELFSCLSDDEMDTLLSILDKLISHWSSGE